MRSSVLQIRYETRGHGRSGAPMNKAAYESARHGEDFKSVCDAFGVKECFVAGWCVLNTLVIFQR